MLSTVSRVYWWFAFYLSRTVCLFYYCIHQQGCLVSQRLTSLKGLDISSLSDVQPARIPSCPEGCPFPLQLPLLHRNFLILCNPTCQLLVLFPEVLHSLQESPCLLLCLEVFFLRTFRVPGLKLKSLINSESLFHLGWERRGFISSWTCGNQFGQHSCLAWAFYLAAFQTTLPQVRSL